MRTTSLVIGSMLALGAGAASSSGCLRSTEYHCADSAECGAGGTCQPEGFCSFVDPACPGGQRFGASAGSLAGTCLGGGDGGIDATVDARAVDGPTTDAPTDGPVDGGGNCTPDFMTIPNGQGTHRYRVAGSANWNAQRAGCGGGAAYLAVPDDAAELQALATFAGAAPFWVGLTDGATEGTWLTVSGAAATFLPWEPGAPDDQGPGEDCVEVTSGTQINDQRCSTQQIAVCECEP